MRTHNGTKQSSFGILTLVSRPAGRRPEIAPAPRIRDHPNRHVDLWADPEAGMVVHDPEGVAAREPDALRALGTPGRPPLALPHQRRGAGPKAHFGKSSGRHAAS